MCGPTGFGVLWGRAGLLEAMPPFLGGGDMIRRVYLKSFQPADLPVPPGINCLRLREGDIKSLGSALQPGTAAILIPPHEIAQPDREMSP